MNAAKARLEFASDRRYLLPAVEFALSCAAGAAKDHAALSRLRVALSAALEMVLSNNADGKSDERIVLEVSEAQGRLRVEILNRGIPILLGGGPSRINAHYYERFREAASHADALSIDNGGRKGQTVIIEARLGAGEPARVAPSGEPANGAEISGDDEVSVRMFAPGDDEAISRLFHAVYGYDYIHEAVYYPDKLRELRQAGDLFSVVAARPNGRLVGHVGLLRRGAHPRVFEAVMGVVDPKIKSRGVFGRLFSKTMELVDETPMQYCLFEFVTNHDLSQRHISKYGFRELALFAGCQSASTQARLERLGLGPDPEGMDRYSLLVAAIPRVQRPFGRELLLPESIGGPYGFLLKPLNLIWSPEPRFAALPPGGRYTAHYNELQSTVLFELEEPGRAAAEGILEEWRELLRDGFQYAAVELELPRKEPHQEAPPWGLGQLHDMLAGSGFFGAGFVPHRMSDRLGFRFQAIAPAKVAFDKIRVATEPARRLLDLVRKDYESVCLM